MDNSEEKEEDGGAGTFSNFSIKSVYFKFSKIKLTLPAATFKLQESKIYLALKTNKLLQQQQSSQINGITNH